MDEEIDYWLAGEPEPEPEADSGPLFPVRDAARERGQTDEEIDRLYGDVRRRENERRAAQGLGPDPEPYSGPRIYNFDVDNPNMSRRQRQAEREAYQFATQSLGRGRLDSEQRDRMEMAQAMRNPEFTQADQMRLNQLQAGRVQVERQVAMGSLTLDEGRQLLSYINSGASMLQARRYQTLETQRKLRERQMMDAEAKRAALWNAEGTINAQELMKRIATDEEGNKYTTDRDGNIRLLHAAGRGNRDDGDDSALWKKAEFEAKVAASRQGLPVNPKQVASVYDRLLQERDMAKSAREEQKKYAGPETMQRQESEAMAVVENIALALKNYQNNPSREAAKAMAVERDELLRKYPDSRAAQEVRKLKLPDPTYQAPKTAGQAISEIDRVNEELKRRERARQQEADRPPVRVLR